MRVSCFYTATVQANCLAALRAYAPQTEYVQVSQADIYDYGQQLAKRWDGSSDLVTVEHDNEITAEVLDSFAACPRPWCSFAYEIFSPPNTRLCDTGLGCTRFSKELQEKFDFAWHVLEKPCGGCGNAHAPHWGELDVRIYSQLSTELNLSVHVHGQVRHYHPYQALEPDENGNFPEVGGFDSFEGGFRRVKG